MVTDPIADMVARIKNGQSARRTTVALPYSKVKHAVAKILKEKGYLDGIDVKKSKTKGELVLTLGDQRIINLRRISKPGRRLYSPAKKLPRPMGGAGVLIISTSKGIMSDREARRIGVGGEMICEVY
ncbi:MAG TPA: 30S ribosomal protein S8 [Patescibacteria group bacterium]|nr:30S ribosomal protein S8 [Patescibacteria group bacterium]